MTDAPWCDHCDLPKAMCQHSVDKAVLAAFDGSGPFYADGPTILAQQETPCPGCKNKIQPGESITHTEQGWAHTSEVDEGGGWVRPTLKPPTNNVDWDI